MTERHVVELTWPNKDLVLRADGEEGYRWVPPECSRALLPRKLEQVSAPGEDEAGGPLSGALISGDALDALECISATPELRGLVSRGVQLVYLDPPFNTGQRFQQYSDSLGRAMWLSMLRDRLVALKPLLAPKASVWVHLDDSEVSYGRCLLDEVFGAAAFVTTIVWQKRSTRESRSVFSSSHDYIHVYAPCGPKQWKEVRNLLSSGETLGRNRDADPRGPWTDAPFTAPGFRKNQQYPIRNPAGVVLRPPKGRSWFATEPVYKSLLRDRRIWFPKAGKGCPRLKLFGGKSRGLVPLSLWTQEEVGSNDDAKRHLMALFPRTEAFSTPKPESLLERVIHLSTRPGDLVLDFFAGSGTTAAVAHKMGRRWIAVERSSSTVSQHAAPRMNKVLLGKDHGGVTKKHHWKGGGKFLLMKALPLLKSSTGDPRAARVATDGGRNLRVVS